MLWTILGLLVVTYFLVDWLLRLPKVGNYGKKFVFITGCDSGFGKELALRLEKLGFHVFAGCLTQDGVTSIRETCSSHVTALHLDVTKVDSIQAAFDEVKTLLPDQKSLWAVVNNAGIGGPFVTSEMCTKNDYLRTFEVNLFGPTEVARIFMPLLRQSQGRLVNMASIGGRYAGPYGPYIASKFAMEGFSDVIRLQVHQFGVKVSIIEPGTFRTQLILNVERLFKLANDNYNRSSPEVKTAYGTDYLDKLKATFAALNEQASTETHKVVDAYVGAITSRYPRDRYVVGIQAKVTVLLSLMPAWLADRFMYWHQNKIYKAAGLSM